MTNLSRISIAAFAILVAAAAAPPAVNVAWDDPSKFTDLRDRRHPDERSVAAYVAQLGNHLRERALRVLSAGDRLDVTVHDVDMAGDFEPVLRSSWSDVRIMKEIYPPRIDLDFVLVRADGTRTSGTCRLLDRSYLTGVERFPNDPLRYEKALLDDWLRADFSCDKR